MNESMLYIECVVCIVILTCTDENLCAIVTVELCCFTVYIWWIVGRCPIEWRGIKTWIRRHQSMLNWWCVLACII